jgi:hypothetical protein
MKKQTQLSLFPRGNDLPLFSGVAPRAEAQPFKAAPPAPKQLTLFDLPAPQPKGKRHEKAE